MSNGLIYRVYTLETRVTNTDANYFKQFAPVYSALCRRIWQDLKHNVTTDSKYVTQLCQEYNMMKRTVNSALRQMKGRMRALGELQKVQIADKQTKADTLTTKIENIKTEINKLKEEVIKHPNDEKLRQKYKNKKAKLYSWQVRKNRYDNDIRNYANPEISNFDLCFGSKNFFRKQYNLAENDYKTHEKWYNDFCKLRDRQIYYIGSAEETCGNQMCQLKYDANTDRFVLKVRKERNYCKLNKKNDKDNYIFIELNFKYKREILLYALENSSPLSYTITNKGGKWYIDVAVSVGCEIWTDTKDGCVGLDFNNGFISLTETNKDGNIVKVDNIMLYNHGTGDKAKSEMSEKVSKIVRYAYDKGKAVCIENLKFNKRKSCCIKKGKKRYNEMLHLLDYARYKKMCEDYCAAYGVMLKLVNPAYTSKIGKQKYANKRKLTVHNSAAYVIARRGQGFKDEYKKKAA